MTIAGAQSQLHRQLEGLWEAVTELVVTVHEDRPRDARAAMVVDDLADTVSELQGDVHHALDRLRRARSRTELAGLLPDVNRAIDRARTRYWRDLRGHRPVSGLRRAAGTHGEAWRAWQHSVERAEGRCEEPFVLVDAALLASVAEVSQLVALGLLPAEHPAEPATPPDHRSGPTPAEPAPDTRSTTTERQPDTTHARRTP